MCCEGRGKISRLENNFLHRVSTSTTCYDSDNLLLQPENFYTVWRVSPEQQTVGHYRAEVGIVNHFQSIYCYIWFD